MKHRFFFLENGRRYVLENGDWRSVDIQGPATQIHLISDALPDVWNPRTNKRYSSKSKYYADTRATGGEIVGNDPAGLRREYKSSLPQEKIGHALYRNWERLGGS